MKNIIESVDNRERIILDISSEIIEVYFISNEYIIQCNNLTTEINESIIKHIEQSPFYEIFLDINFDIFNQEKISDFRTLRTDGKWVWSADLNFYTRKHNFQWPLKFLKHLDDDLLTIPSDDEICQIINIYQKTFFNIYYEYPIKREGLLEYKIIHL